MEFLELRWREHIERAVAPAVVVGRLDVFEDRVGELDPCLPSSAVEQLDLHPAQNDSIIALSRAVPVRPTDGISSASFTRWVKAQDVNWVDSTGRRNT